MASSIMGALQPATAPVTTGPSFNFGSLPLGGDALATVAARRRDASRVYQEALARNEQQRGQVDSRHALATADLTRGFSDARSQLLHQLAAFGAARSPRQAGRPVREMRDQLGSGLAGLEAERAELLGILLQMAQDAERQHGLALSDVEADAARLGIDFGRLLPGVGF